MKALALTPDPATSGLNVDIPYPSVAGCFAQNLSGADTVTWLHQWLAEFQLPIDFVEQHTLCA